LSADAAFRIFETNSFLSGLEQDFGGRKEKIRQKLLAYVYPQLRGQPYFGKNIKKLKNYEPETWRYRIGDYRFFYEIGALRKIVFMTAADNRSDAY
jgi:mRNA interferase RelE/StbE